MSKLSVVLVVTLSAALLSGIVAHADTLPTGERTLGQSVIEPAYNEANGSLVYLLTPSRAPLHANQAAVAPLYVIMYPTSAAGAIGTVNCQHQPADNCPDHGPELAALAAATVPSVYGSGVWGHDHLLAAPPAPPPSGGDFNIAWEPVAVLFTSPAAAATHITTLAQLDAVRRAGSVMEIPLPAATFHCSVVPAVTYNQGTPVTPTP